MNQKLLNDYAAFKKEHDNGIADNYANFDLISDQHTLNLRYAPNEKSFITTAHVLKLKMRNPISYLHCVIRVESLLNYAKYKIEMLCFECDIDFRTLDYFLIIYYSDISDSNCLRFEMFFNADDAQIQRMKSAPSMKYFFPCLNLENRLRFYSAGWNMDDGRMLAWSCNLRRHNSNEYIIKARIERSTYCSNRNTFNAHAYHSDVLRNGALSLKLRYSPLKDDSFLNTFKRVDEEVLEIQKRSAVDFERNIENYSNTQYFNTSNFNHTVQLNIFVLIDRFIELNPVLSHSKINYCFINTMSMRCEFESEVTFEIDDQYREAFIQHVRFYFDDTSLLSTLTMPLNYSVKLSSLNERNFEYHVNSYIENDKWNNDNLIVIAYKFCVSGQVHYDACNTIFSLKATLITADRRKMESLSLLTREFMTHYHYLFNWEFEMYCNLEARRRCIEQNIDLLNDEKVSLMWLEVRQHLLTTPRLSGKRVVLY